MSFNSTAMRAVKHYGYRSAMVVGPVGSTISFPAKMFESIRQEWHQQLGTHISNHEVFEFLDENYRTLYVLFSDGVAIFGDQISITDW